MVGESPNLYKAKYSIIDKKEKQTYEYKILEFVPLVFSAEGFLLNGKKILLNGGCVHHDNGALGAAAYDRAEERKVELLKTAGFNAVRTSHNPPSEAFLDACDRLGMFVIDEAFDGWRKKKTDMIMQCIFDKWWKHDVESMVMRTAIILQLLCGVLEMKSLKEKNLKRLKQQKCWQMHSKYRCHTTSNICNDNLGQGLGYF